MSDLPFPPGLILILGAFALPLLKGSARQAMLLALPLITLWVVWSLSPGSHAVLQFLDYQIHPVNVTASGRLFATIFCIMAFAGALFAIGHARWVELISAYVYAGSAVGVTFSGDLITLFIFWELMALGSTMVIWSADSDRAWMASFRYLQIHLLGGMFLLIGIVWRVNTTGTLEFGPMLLDHPANILILLGFLVNAGAPPLSAWIPDTYPEASPSGMVFLSAFTTKTAVFALLVGFPGAEILIWVGLYMVFYGIIYALLENDMRRILAYSIVNQVGFMVCAIGIGTELALNGAAAHAFAHIIYKALLLMSAGSVLFMTGKRKCTDLGGLFQTMPVTAINGIIGAMAISAFPFTSGFISKSLETAAAAEQGMAVVWFLLLAASAGVFLHAGIKFPWFVFFQKDSGLRPDDPPLGMKISMWLFSFLCIAIGIWPSGLYNILPFQTDYQPYSVSHLVSQSQLLLFAGCAFFVLLPIMKRTLTISLDFDWFYRHFGRMVANELTIHSSQAIQQLGRSIRTQIKSFINQLYQHHGPQGILARTWPSGAMVLWVAIMLAGMIIAAALF